MKIVHLCLACFYPDNYSYQENILPKYHKKMGYDTEVIASLETFDKNGQATHLDKACCYQNEYNIKVTRLDYKKPQKVFIKLKKYIGTFKMLEIAAPNILFIHGCQFMDMSVVIKYLKSHPNVTVYVDNHADFSNSATNWLSKNILHKKLWRHYAKKIEPYTTKFYGVLPARVDFLKNIYKLPTNKCELLVMGAEDEKVMAAKKTYVRYNIRSKHGIKDDDFLIISGGKIDQWKTQTLLLMEAVAKIDNPKVKLIIFGSITPNLKKQVNSLCINNKILYIGWISSNESYQYFSSAELVVFPGRHSVFWEQVAGLGIPMVCKYWDGTTHIDVGGNVEFIQNDTVDNISNILQKIINEPNKYKKMKEIAENLGMKKFSYKLIAATAVQKI